MGSKSRVTDVDDCKLSSIVLKVTTFTDPNADAPMFVVGTSGARIGKDEVNDISVPSDSKMNGVAHAVIEFSEGSFFLRDGGFDHSAAVKLVPRRKVWVLETDSRFSAGASVFKSCGRNSEGALLLEIVAGPLRGERRFVSKKGLTIGRAIDNSISLPADRELSRKHSEIVFDDATSQFYICDVGSTNGTYMQLVGPYASRKYKLNINDNVLVARTGFSVNRFDIGFSEEIGVRSTMEDNTAIYQYLKIPGLSNPLVSPLSYLAVYDGHGGSAASAYLSKSLHANVVDCLASAARDIQAAAGVAEQTALDEIITRALRDAFITTDAAFLSSSPDSEHGSTATVVLVMGQRLYCANVGDSRTVLSRNFAAVPLSSDHRPSREDEAKRIKDAGGHIISNRVMGVLAVSRSFGDANLKKSVRVRQQHVRTYLCWSMITSCVLRDVGNDGCGR
jgi:serine/threonine protein phosphatase PrpC